MKVVWRVELKTESSVHTHPLVVLADVHAGHKEYHILSSIPKLTKSCMWRPDNYMKQNLLVAWVGSIRPMDSHFAGSHTSPWSMAMLDFGRLLLDPKSFVNAKYQTMQPLCPYFVWAYTSGGTVPGERRMVCKKRVLNSGNASGYSHYPILLTPQFSHCPFPLKYFYYSNQADRCFL